MVTGIYTSYMDALLWRRRHAAVDRANKNSKCPEAEADESELLARSFEAHQDTLACMVSEHACSTACMGLHALRSQSAGAVNRNMASTSHRSQVANLLSIVCCLTAPYVLLADSQCQWDKHMSSSIGTQAEPAGRNTRRLIDISVAIHDKLPSWQKTEGLGVHRELVERQDEGGVAFVSKVELVVHTGTHFDAPSHFLQEAFESGRGMEAIQLHIMNGVLLTPIIHQQLTKILPVMHLHISALKPLACICLA